LDRTFAGNEVFAMLLAFLGVLVGIVLGTRYRAFVLIPATVIAWIAVAALGLGLGSGFALMAAAMMMMGAALQFGFLIGIAIRTVASAARGATGGRAPRTTETPQLPAAP
jgi:hypothetical protein